jgi:hypothetical protein
MKNSRVAVQADKFVPVTIAKRINDSRCQSCTFQFVFKIRTTSCLSAYRCRKAASQNCAISASLRRLVLFTQSLQLQDQKIRASVSHVESVCASYRKSHPFSTSHNARVFGLAKECPTYSASAIGLWRAKSISPVCIVIKAVNCSSNSLAAAAKGVRFGYRSLNFGGISR